MEFLQKVRNSIYNPAYYTELLSKPASYSFRYFFTFVFYLVLVLTVIFSFASVPAAQSLFNFALQKAMDIYPAELELKLDKGVVSSNVPEPYFIKIPDDQKKTINRNGTDFQNFLVIDTKTPFSVEEFKNYKTVALLTRNTVVYHKNDKATEIQSLETFPNVTLNKSVVSGWLEKVRPLGKFIPAAVVLGTFVGLYVFNVFNLFTLLFEALIVWLFFWFWGIKGGYKKAYQIGLHALTLPILLYYLSFIVLPVSYFTGVFGLIFLVVIFVNLRFSSRASKDN